MSKKDLLEPRLNFSVAPESMTTLEGTPSVPGRRPLEPPTPSWSVPEATRVPPVQVVLRIAGVDGQVGSGSRLTGLAGQLPLQAIGADFRAVLEAQCGGAKNREENLDGELARVLDAFGHHKIVDARRLGLRKTPVLNGQPVASLMLQEYALPRGK